MEGGQGGQERARVGCGWCVIRFEAAQAHDQGTEHDGEGARAREQREGREDEERVDEQRGQVHVRKGDARG